MPHSEQLSRSDAGAVLSVRSASTASSSAVYPTPTRSPVHSKEPVSLERCAAVDITVAIPTYNGADRLPMVLDRVRSQIGLDGVSWEIIVCDNSSTDSTARVVQQYQTDWPERVPLHYRFAAEQGAAFARQRAVECASGELIAFLDDDNLPAENWLAQAFSFANAHPEAGAFGSQIHGQFESELPKDLENIKCFLAIIERGNEPHLYEPANKILPPAAGLVVRKSAWLTAVPPRLFLNNKGKEAGLASEDLEALLHIQKAGHEIWYNPAMVVHHDIPDGRLRKDYLVTLFRCVGLSRFHIRLLGLEDWKRPAAIPAYIANDICKLALHRIRYGARQQLSTTEECDRTLLASTVVSPFFLLKKAYKDVLQSQRDKKYGDYRQQLDQLTQAFEQDQLMLYQQPVLSLNQSALGANLSAYSPGQLDNQKELLLRLRTSQGECVLPHNFLPAARRYQVMRTLDRWVIRHLISHVATIAHKGELPQAEARQRAPLYSVNLSAQSVCDPKLAGFIAGSIAQAGLPAAIFCFEIDAAIASSAAPSVTSLIRALHSIGCQVTLDNTVISRETIHQLSYLPVDYVKLGSDYLASALSDTLRERQIAQDWIQLQAALDERSVEAIAKGIESSEQLEAVRQQGIRYAQGYKMAMPQPL